MTNYNCSIESYSSKAITVKSIINARGDLITEKSIGADSLDTFFNGLADCDVECSHLIRNRTKKKINKAAKKAVFALNVVSNVRVITDGLFLDVTEEMILSIENSLISIVDMCRTNDKSRSSDECVIHVKAISTGVEKIMDMNKNIFKLKRDRLPKYDKNERCRKRSIAKFNKYFKKYLVAHIGNKRLEDISIKDICLGSTEDKVLRVAYGYAFKRMNSMTSKVLEADLDSYTKSRRYAFSSINKDFNTAFFKMVERVSKYQEQAIRK